MVSAKTQNKIFLKKKKKKKKKTATKNQLFKAINADITSSKKLETRHAFTPHKI